MIEVLIGVCATVVMWALVGYMIGRDLASSDKTHSIFRRKAWRLW